MKYLPIYFLLIITITQLFGCVKSIKSPIELDSKSYIKDFELIQKNPTNQTSIKILSPNAIIDTIKNDIEIFDSTIDILTKDVLDFKVKSGNSTLSNLTNSINVFNNVRISFFNDPDYYISTNSITWDLNTSMIDINNPVNIYFNNTRINATSGLYNINDSLLQIKNSEFYRSNFTSEGYEDYQVKIKSDFAKWLKSDNILIFTSNDKQVETTINFLTTK